MGLTFRGEKGSPLLHTELDNNFREFFYSASVSGSELQLFRSRSLDSTVYIPLSYPKGEEYSIQFKKGAALSGSGTFFSGSENFKFDFLENRTKITGSLHISSSTRSEQFVVHGSGSIYGDLTVGGKVTAEEFITEKVATTYIYKSGSTKFGDGKDDIHSFTGSTNISSSLLVTGRTFISGSTTISGSKFLKGQTIISGNLEHLGTVTLSGSFDQLGTFSNTGTSFFNGIQEFTGSLSHSGSTDIIGNVDIKGNTDITGNTTLSGSLTQVGDQIITGSIYQIGNYIQSGNLDMAGFKVNSNEISASANITIGSFEFLTGEQAYYNQTESAPFLLLAGPNGAYTSSQILFADAKNATPPFHSGMGIRYDSRNNRLTFDRNSEDPAEGGINNPLMWLSRDGNLTISGSLTQISDEDTVFTGSLVVTEVVSGSRGKIELGLSAGSLTGSIDASNLENVPYAVTASNTFYGDQNVVGDVTASNLDVSGNTLIEGNLTVNGTGSFAVIQSITGSAKIIGDAFIQLNENTPSERYAGLQVVDSGSSFSTASFFFDGLENNWMYEYDGDDTEYALALFGPEFATKGSPVSLTQNIIPKATGSHHLVDSNISDDGSTISLSSNVAITGTLTATDDITAFYSSDERLKDNIIQISDPIEKVKQIKGVEFDWNDKQEVYEGHDVGVIAQDIEKVLPELVITRDNGYKAVKYEKIIALLIEAVKEQQSQIDELKRKI